MKQQTTKLLCERFKEQLNEEYKQFGITPHQIGKVGLISSHNAKKIIERVNEVKVYEAICFLATIGKTIEVVDMPRELYSKLNEELKSK